MGKVEVPAWVLSGLKRARIRMLETAKVKLESVSEESGLLVMEEKEREGLDEQ